MRGIKFCAYFAVSFIGRRYSMGGQPDFENIRKAARHEEGERVPLFEVLVEYPIQSQFLGREVSSDDLEAQLDRILDQGRV